MDSRVTAKLLVHLGRIASGDGLIAGLTAGQWAVLRYFGHANRFSRTPSAFAAFHGTTRGTASQTIKTLIAQGYLHQSRSDTDGRSVRLDLADKARATLAKDPLNALVRAADDLPPGLRSQFSNGLQRIMGHMASETGKPCFGTCKNCAYFKEDQLRHESLPPIACGFLNEPLIVKELDELCINFALDMPSMPRAPNAEVA